MKETIYRIFKIADGKSYIGKTDRDAYLRLSEHCKPANLKKNKPLYKAFSKYGLDAFSFEVLGEYDKELKAEQHFIKLYNSYGSTGYNATLGGEGTSSITILDSEVISYYRKVKSIEQTHRDLKLDRGSIRSILKRNGVSILSVDLVNRNKDSRSVVFDGIEFDNCVECADYLVMLGLTDNKDLINVGSSIRRVCTGLRKSYLGKQFYYADVV